MLNLLQVFNNFVQDYHALQLANFHTKSSFTLKELNYFFELGQKLGYESFTEDTTGSYRAMDLSWWTNFNDGYWDRLVLHLERENLWKKDKETLQKLFQEQREYPPENAIGLIAVPNLERVKKLIKEAEKRCNVNNALLIFRVNPDTMGGSKAIAYFLKENKVVEQKTAYVFVEPKTEYLFMGFTPPA